MMEEFGPNPDDGRARCKHVGTSERGGVSKTADQADQKPLQVILSPLVKLAAVWRSLDVGDGVPYHCLLEEWIGTGPGS